ncbi:hypothetical protein [Puerhibacterium sp. TATVAM-FAB25]|uniref:hypothetical protein n=1 Tax=Puerhibacterium sp. TATVAM-FAB25 TaxID=3093699 RepID=UPI00397ADF81
MAAEARQARGRALTLAEWARRSVDGKTLRPSTRYRYERVLATRILPELGDIPLAQLTRLDVTDGVRRAWTRSLGGSTRCSYWVYRRMVPCATCPAPPGSVTSSSPVASPS